MAIRFTPTVAVPERLYLTVKLACVVVMSPKTIVVFAPAVVPPLLTTDTVMIGGNLKLG